MVWQRVGSRGDGEVTSGVNLRSLAGLPGRLSFAQGPGRQRMVHAPCTVRKVDASEITLDLPAGAPQPHPESAVILEVANHHALVQCFTSVVSGTRDSVLTLRTPARPHVVQRRRFPRIELFLGISVHTPDRPIEASVAQMINLSIDGAAVVLAEQVEPGTRLVLNLTNVGFHPPEVQAVVRRCTPTPSQLWVLGVQFADLTPSQELYLGKYITDHMETSQD